MAVPQNMSAGLQVIVICWEKKREREREKKVCFGNWTLNYFIIQRFLKDMQ